MLQRVGVGYQDRHCRVWAHRNERALGKRNRRGEAEHRVGTDRDKVQRQKLKKRHEAEDRAPWLGTAAIPNEKTDIKAHSAHPRPSQKPV